MPWTTIVQSETGNNQYLIASSSDINNDSTDILNIAGYNRGTIAGVGALTSASMKVEGSLDGTNFFDIISATTFNPTTNFVAWGLPVKFIKATSTTAVAITDIFIMLIAGGIGHITFNSIGKTTFIKPANPPKSIQYNDHGFMGGADGSLYDRTPGQIKLASGTVGEPILAFSDGIHPAGNYNSGIYRSDIDEMSISINSLQQMSISDNVSIKTMLNLKLDTNFEPLTGSTDYTCETSYVRAIASAAAATITTMSATGVDNGTILIIEENGGTATLIITNSNPGGGGSTNGFICPGSADITLTAGGHGTAMFIFIPVLRRWVCISVSSN